MPPPSGSFLDTMGSLGNLIEVTIRPGGEADPSRSSTQARCLVQAKKGWFELGAPVYEGDWVDMPDPRGGTERRYVSKVEQNNMPGLDGMSHTAVTWGTPPMPGQQPSSVSSTPTVVHNAPVIYVNGTGATQIAWNNDQVDQTQTVSTVAPGYESLAQTIAALVQARPDLKLSESQAEIFDDTTREVLEEISLPSPDAKRLRRALAGVAGVFAPILIGAQTGAGQGVAALVKEFITKLGNGQFGL